MSVASRHVRDRPLDVRSVLGEDAGALAEELVPLIEEAIDARPRPGQAVEQVFDLLPVLGRHVLRGGREVSDAGERLADIGPILGDRPVRLGDQGFQPPQGGLDPRHGVVELPGGRDDGRTDGLGRLAEVVGRRLEGGEDLAEARAGRLGRLADLGDRLAQVVALDRSEADLIQDRVEHRGLDARDDLPRHQRHGRAAGGDDVDARLAGQAGVDGDLDILPEPGGEVAGHGQADLRPDGAIGVLGQVDGRNPAGIEARDPHGRADADALGVAEDDVEVGPAGQEAGAPPARASRPSMPARATTITRPTRTSWLVERLIGGPCPIGRAGRGRRPPVRSNQGVGGVSTVGPNAGPA